MCCMQVGVRDMDLVLQTAHLGSLPSFRTASLGPCSTRLLLAAYCLLILVSGLLTVLKLPSHVEVDTRRKVFHGMMVLMLLPTIFVDPAFVALALVIILAVFLLLDLIRASQLPPLSKPIASPLAPYSLHDPFDPILPSTPYSHQKALQDRVHHKAQSLKLTLTMYKACNSENPPSFTSRHADRTIRTPTKLSPAPSRPTYISRS